MSTTSYVSSPITPTYVELPEKDLINTDYVNNDVEPYPSTAIQEIIQSSVNTQETSLPKSYQYKNKYYTRNWTTKEELFLYHIINFLKFYPTVKHKWKEAQRYLQALTGHNRSPVYIANHYHHSDMLSRIRTSASGQPFIISRLFNKKLKRENIMAITPPLSDSCHRTLSLEYLTGPLWKSFPFRVRRIR